MVKKSTNKQQGNPAVVNKNLHPELNKKRLVIMALIVALLGFVLYSNTFNHKFVLDDIPTIKGNFLTKQGFAGIPKLLQTAYWYGSDGKNEMFYRPLSVVMFAAEWELWPDNPTAGHVINVLLYALTGFILFFTLRKLFIDMSPLIPFAASLLFIAHPLHTEVVANIKSRDEILSFLFLLISLNTLLDYVRNNVPRKLIISLFCFFLALMSKESSILYLVIFPVAVFYYTSATVKKNAVIMAGYVFAAVIYMIIRASVLDRQMVGEIASVIDNTVSASDYPHRFATAMVIIGTYIKLLIIPHPLVYDYSFATFKIVGPGNVWALLSVLVYVSIGIYIFRNFLKKDTIVFSLIIYLLPVILVSNIFFLTRSTAAERFLYQPSLGFAIIASLLLAKVTGTEIVKRNFYSISTLIKNNMKLFGLVGVLLVLYSFKTYKRAETWKDNLTLFRTDLQYIPNSARAQFNYAKDLTTKLVHDSIKTPAEQERVYNEAITAANRALQIIDGYVEPYYLLGQLAGYKKNYARSIEYYKKVMSRNNQYLYMYNNLGTNYYRLNQLDSAMKYLNIAIKMQPDYAEAYSNLGAVYTARGMQKKAIDSYTTAIALVPGFYDAYVNMGNCYGIMKDYTKALGCFLKGLKIKNNDPGLYSYIGMTYGFMGDTVNARIYNDRSVLLKQSR
ncbi:MAG: tetratricopeptide repeat protein [Bacteroidetes bacterium]|nr:tetratricopeptide repeat protein [Bacteroidota bacterium]